jgi:hypothetical protein
MVSFTTQPLYPRGKRTGTHWIGGSGGKRASLDDGKSRRIKLKKLNAMT